MHPVVVLSLGSKLGLKLMVVSIFNDSGETKEENVADMVSSKAFVCKTGQELSSRI